MSEWVAVLATERGGIRSKYQSRTQSEFADQVHPGVMVGCGALKENEFKHATSAVAAGTVTLLGTQLLLLPVRAAVTPSSYCLFHCHSKWRLTASNPPRERSSSDCSGR